MEKTCSKNDHYSEENYEKLLVQIEILDKLVDKRMNEIKRTSSQINYKNLTYYLKNKNLPKRFIDFKPLLGFYRNMRWFYNTEKAKDNQKEFKLDLNEITRGKPAHKLEQQKSAIENIK